MRLFFLRTKQIHMKRPLLLTLSALSIIALTTLQSYKDGPATNLTQATDAPGSSNNNCTTCHGGGSFGSASISFEMMSDSGVAVTEYVPGEVYTLNARVNHTSGTPSGFGLQMVALNDADNSTAGSWDNPSANAKLVTLSTRRYFEQTSASSTNLFTVDWTAPAEGTGAVTFYMGANAVNGNNATSGDNAVLDQLTFEEGEAVNGILSVDLEQLSIFPNPVMNTLNVSGLKQDDQLEIFSINGQKMAIGFESNESIDVSDLPIGIYILKTDTKVARFVKR